MRARQIMSTPVIAVSPEDTVKHAATLLARHGFTALPVVDDDRLVGMVTEADVVRDRIPADARTRGLDGAPTPPPRTVGAVMTTPAVGIGAGTDVAVVARTMLEDRSRCLPVVDGGQVVGVITRADLVRVLARADDRIAADVRRHLGTYGGPDRYTVAVRDGEATITDTFDDATEHHVARVLAEAVPGVVRAQVRAAT
ncbi:CBS domain-containing protein [Actinokineospora diospyrosa]|uniref:CBS domain-containing protein n=1 Tax=Actinokineospora diospyrosa TaxID=103728 RepID=A0ABT1IIR5_9PSEU|nr:CBS domain-containing protein [Actinokineospora diospyrosa]MCP2272531.1 CBS domain-containing protein [Actinokineospora diospyrosa]